MIRSRRIGCGAASVLLVAALFLLTQPPFLRSVARFLDVSGPPRRADYAMVLGGGIETRPFAAAALLRHGWVRRILISELPLWEDRDDAILPPEHDVTRRILTILGVPDDAVVLLRGDHASTFDEIVSLRDFLRDHPEATVLVVTDALHTRRTAWSVRRVLGPDAERVGFISAAGDGFDPNRWWAYPEGFYFVLSEYLKLVFYLFRYMDRWTFAVAFAVVLCIAALILVLTVRRLRGSTSRKTHG